MLTDGIAALVGAFQLGLAPPPRLTVTAWADRYRRLPTKGSGEPGPWRTSRVPYLAEIMDCLSAQHPARRVVLIKSAQVAGTEAILNWMGWFIATQRAPMMVVQPTIEVAERFSKQRVAAMIDDCSVLRELIPPARSRDSGNTTLLKEYPGGVVILSGANSGASLRSLPIRYLALDEVDAYPHDLDGEGDPISLAEARTTTFPRRKVFLCSTPTIESLSRIHREWLASDMRRYCVPCPHCGAFHPLRWESLTWPDGEPHRARYHCPECHRPIPEHHKTAMLASGIWMAEHPDRPTPGFHLNGLYAPLGLGLQWVELAAEWEGKKRDSAQAKTFINTRLGECFADPDEKIDWDELKQRAEEREPRAIPPGCLILTAGIDVQKDRFALIVLGHGRDHITWVIDYVELPADPSRAQDWAVLAAALSAPFERGLTITAAAIDCGYLTEDVLLFTRQHRGKVIAVKGSSQANRPIIGKPSKVDFTWRGQVIKGGAEIWQIGHDTAKAQLFARLAGDRQHLPHQRLVRFPTGLDDSFYSQLTAEIWDSTKRRWVKIRPRNEALDCFDSETDVLTARGWRRFADLLPDDSLATVNLENDLIEYQQPTALIARPYDGDMVCLKGTRIDILVTPNHRMVTYTKEQVTILPGVRKWNFNVPPKITLAKDLTTHHAIKLHATWQGTPITTIEIPAAFTSDKDPIGIRNIQLSKSIDAGDFAEFMGWWISDGSAIEQRSKTQGNTRRRVHIAQIKSETRSNLLALLKKLPWKFTEIKNGFFCTSKQLYAYVVQFGRTQPYRCVPEWIKSSPPDVIARFVDAAIAGDGWSQQKKPYHRVSRAYATISPQLADDMQELFIKLGRSATLCVVPAKPYAIRGRTGHNTQPQYHVHERLADRAYLDGGGNGKRGYFGVMRHYSGMVYCATVPNGTLIVRRGGKAFVAGNCFSYATAAAMQPALRLHTWGEAQWAKFDPSTPDLFSAPAPQRAAAASSPPPAPQRAAAASSPPAAPKVERSTVLSRTRVSR